jgi:hypothetical protein
MTICASRTLLQARARLSFCFALAVLAVLPGCDTDGGGGATPMSQTFRYDFEEGLQEWEAFFAVFPVGGEEAFELESDHRDLPEPLDATKETFYIAGFNHSDALKMLLKRRVQGLKPGATYQVRFEIALATRAPTGCTGAGGSPGEGVIVAGLASTTEPVARVANDGYYRIDEEIISKAGHTLARAKIGNVANDLGCREAQQREFPYRMKQVESGAQSWNVEADSEGQVWLVVGTRSGFVSKTSLYYDRIEVILRPAE